MEGFKEIKIDKQGEAIHLHINSAVDEEILKFIQEDLNLKIVFVGNMAQIGLVMTVREKFRK